MIALLREALLQLRRQPGANALLVVLLALGIGVNAGLFALAQQTLLRPLPLPQPERVVRIFSDERASGQIGNGSFPWFAAMAAETDVFEAVAPYFDGNAVNLAMAGAPTQRVAAGFASGPFFQTLRARPLLGRLIAPDDDRSVGAHPVVVVSERFWRRTLAGDPGILGRELRINRRAYQVIGVLQPGFESPDLSNRVDLWMPLAMAAQALDGLPEDFRTRASMSWLDGVARLRDRIEPGTAQAALDAWAERRIQAREPGAAIEGRGPHARLIDLRNAAIDPYGTEFHRRNAWLLVGVALLVLAIAGANAAGLMAVRSEERLRDFAVRASLGAGRRQLLALLLAEAAWLVLFGLLLGAVLARTVALAVVQLAPSGLALPEDALAGGLAYAPMLVACACALLLLALAALLPMRRVGRLDVSAVLRSGGRSGTDERGRQRLRGGLVAAQLALTLVLLSGALSLLQTLQRTAAVELGFDPARVLAATVTLSRPGMPAEEQARLRERVRAAAATLPGVTHAAWIGTAPVHDGGMRTSAETGLPGTPRDADAQVDANLISPGALEALGVPLLRGRALREEDMRDAPVVVVNRAYAERFLPGIDPLQGRILSLSAGHGGARVIGVVGNHKRRSLREGDIPQIYAPLHMLPMGTLTLLLRSDGDPGALAPALQRRLAEIDPELPVFRVRPLHEQVHQSEHNTRVFAGLLAAFAALSALLAGTGIHGLLSHWLRLRERELGIRVAVGARGADLSALVLGQGGRLLLLGILAGLPLVYAAARVVDGLSFGVSAADPAIVASAAALLAGMLLLACAPPLRRALRADPCAALRSE